MDWLLESQEGIEAKLAARHLQSGGVVLYDLSSSYFEGTSCPLAARGHNRDGKKGKLQVNYGLLTDRRGCPIAVSVYKGNTGDGTTFLPQVRKLRDQFGLEHVVLVGDRGMISKASIAALRNEQFSWITALKAAQIRTLIDAGTVQIGLFDERNLVEITHPDFPAERLMACRNPELAKLRAHTRTSLLEATTKELEEVRGMVARGTLRGRDLIGVRNRKAGPAHLLPDDGPGEKGTRHPVAPAQPPAAAQTKALTHSLEDGTPAHSFHTLLHALSSIVRNVCRIPGQPTLSTFPMTTTPNTLQRRARELLDQITV